VAGEVAGGWWSRALQDERLAYVGTISYGLYLIHWPVQVWAKTVLPDLTNVVRGPLVVAVSFALAAVSRRWYESVFLRRKPHPVADLASTAD
jgi:peptidoglycan/LPS O-acetylase OafA/YrhL